MHCAWLTSHQSSRTLMFKLEPAIVRKLSTMKCAKLVPISPVDDSNGALPLSLLIHTTAHANVKTPISRRTTSSAPGGNGWGLLIAFSARQDSPRPISQVKECIRGDRIAAFMPVLLFAAYARRWIGP